MEWSSWWLRLPFSLLHHFFIYPDFPTPIYSFLPSLLSLRSKHKMKKVSHELPCHRWGLLNLRFVFTCQECRQSQYKEWNWAIHRDLSRLLATFKWYNWKKKRSMYVVPLLHIPAHSHYLLWVLGTSNTNTERGGGLGRVSCCPQSCPPSDRSGRTGNGLVQLPLSCMIFQTDKYQDSLIHSSL